MSKTVKELMIRDYQRKFEGVDNALVISIRGVSAIENNRMRVDLAGKDIRVTVVRNSLTTYALKGGALSAIEPLLTGPTALAYGAESVVDVARALVDWAKKIEHLELKGALLDGELFEGPKGVERLSKFPTRAEALGATITLILSPARKLAGQIVGPGGRVLGVVKTIREKLEKNETIARVG